MYKNNIRNIGIVAHVDAGKTTVSEQLLFQSGTSRTLGSVNKGTTHTDTLEVERQRGISVKSSEIDFKFRDTSIYLIDTPGHIDFIGEVQHSLGVLDGAIIVISSVESVQPQTETYFNALKELDKPAIFFINKLDRIGSDPLNVINDIKKLLSKKIIPIQLIEKVSSEFCHKDLFSNIISLEDHKFSSIIEDMIALLSEENPNILDKYYCGDLSVEELKSDLITQCKNGLVYPVLFGTATKGHGIKDLLNSIIDYLPPPKNLDNEDLCALVYKISHHKTFGRISHIKIFSGSIRSRDEVFNVSTGVSEKATVLKKIIDQKECDIKEAFSGELVMVSGFTSSVSDILGNPSLIPTLPSIANALLTLQVIPNNIEEYIALVDALTILQAEDPLLNMEWVKDKNEVHISITGAIQIEIIQTILKERFNLNVTFGEPSVIYKETPSRSGYVNEEYTMPKPCWAIITLLIEPLPLGSGIIYESDVGTDTIKLRYQREIENNIHKLLKQGYYGWNVTDLKITLVDGEDHVMHSRSGNFITATAIALMNGFKSIGMTLLEPIVDFKISVPQDIGGKVLNDIIQMRGSFNSPVVCNDIFAVTGKVPVSTSMNYAITLGTISSGRGVMNTRFSHYAPCALELGATREYLGVNPLNRSKYILFSRNAL